LEKRLQITTQKAHKQQAAILNQTGCRLLFIEAEAHIKRLGLYIWSSAKYYVFLHIQLKNNITHE
jgi:hypothetical protein